MSSEVAGELRRPLSEKVQSLRMPVGNRKTGGSVVPWVLCLLLVCATAVLGYREYQRYLVHLEELDAVGMNTVVLNNSPARPQKAASGGDAAAVAPAAPEEDPDGVALQAKGYIIPTHQILVSPKVSGMVLELNFEEGMVIQKGEILAKLETTEYQADFQSAKALVAVAQQTVNEREAGNRPEEISAAEAELGEAEAQAVQLKSQRDRTRLLHKGNNISKDEYEQAEAAYLAMERRVVRLKNQLVLMEKGERIERKSLAVAQLDKARADLDKAKWRLDNCTIIAPISGTILKKNAEEGNIVNPVAFNGSFSLCDMADLSDLEVELNIQERDIAQVFKGQRCEIRAEAFPSRKYVGYVSRLMPIADRSKAAIPVRVKLQVPADEDGTYLKPEMGAIVSFFGKEKKPSAEKPAADKAPADKATSDEKTIEKAAVAPRPVDGK